MAMNMNIAQIQAMAADLGARTLGQVGILFRPHVEAEWVLPRWRPAMLATEQIMQTNVCRHSCCAFLESIQAIPQTSGLLTDG